MPINNLLCVWNSGRMDLVYDDMRYMVYRWGFSCLDYSFNVLISWSHKLGCTTGFVVFIFIWFYFRFLVLFYYYYYIIYSWFYHLCTAPLISCCYHIVHNQFASQCTCTTVLNLLTCLLLVLYGFFSYRIILASWWFILFT